MNDSCWFPVSDVVNGRGRGGVGRGGRGWRVRSGRVVGLVLVLVLSVVVPVGAVEGVLTPTGLSASSVEGGVLLEWDAPEADSGSVTGYRIVRRRTDVGERRLSQLVPDTETTSTSYLDESAVDGGTYIYRVRAMRGGERSAISDKATIVYEVPPIVEPEFEEVWSSVLTVETLVAGVPGYQSYMGPSYAQGSLLPDRFTVDGESFRVMALFNHAGLVFGLSHEPPRDFVLRAGGREFVASDSMVQSMGTAQGRYWWPTDSMGWSEGDEVELSIAVSVSGSKPERALAPPSGVFDVAPGSHDGVSSFKVQLLFDEKNLPVTAGKLRDHALVVVGADIVGVRKTGSNRWFVTLQPTGVGAVTVTLPETTDCAQPDAICASDGRKLRASVEAIIAGSADASLSTLDVGGVVIDPVFGPVETLYTADAAPGVSQVTVTAEATAAAHGATVSITPADTDPAIAGHQVDLTAGADTAIQVTVTAPDTTTTQRYWLVVSESSIPADATSALNSMQFSGLETLTFDDDENRYQLTAPPDTTHTTVVTGRADTGATVETITVRVGTDGLYADADDADANAPGHQVHLAETGDTLVIVRVTTSDGLSQSVYLTLITRTADTPAGPTTNATRTQQAPTPKDTALSELSSLTLTDADLDSAFSANTVQYRAVAASDVEDTALPELSTLTLTDADLDSAFSANTVQYRATAAGDVEQVTVAAEAADADASVLILPVDADPDTDGWQITLGAPGSETNIVVIVSSNGKLDSYLVTVARETVQTATTLESLSIDGHELTPVFDPATYLYAADAPAEVSEVTIRVVATDPAATITAAPADADPNRSGHQLSLGAPGTLSTTSVAFVVSVPGTTAHSTYVVAVTRAAPDPADASLRSLTVDGYNLTPAFDSDTYPYEVSVPAQADSVTVDAVTASLVATVTVTPADTDPLQPGHQVPLGAVEQGGEPSVTTVTVVVDSQDNANTNTYTILITRAVPRPAFAHDPDRDIATLWAGGSAHFPRLWSDGEVMWATNNNEYTINAYDLATGAPLPERDIALDTSSWLRAWTRGLWSDGETLWVLDADERVLAYDLATGDRLPDSDISYLHPNNNTAEGLWSDGEILWVSNANDNDKVFAYDFETGDRLPHHDFNGLVAAGNTAPMGLWSDGETMWVADTDRLYAYDLYTGDRRPSLDFDTDALSAAGINGTWMGLWSDGETMWVISTRGDVIAAFNMPVRAPPGPAFEHNPDRDIATLWTGGSAHFPRLWSDGEIMWATNNNEYTINAYDLATGAPLPERDIALDRSSWLRAWTRGLWSDGETLWVLDADERVLAYDLATGDRLPDSDISYLHPNNNTAEGLWSDGEILWVSNANDNDKVFAYDFETGDRLPHHDFNGLVAAGNTAPMGLWSDGETMWVADTDRLYAYDLYTGDRRPSLDFDTDALSAAGINGTWMGLWSDGETMWVISTRGDVIAAFNMPTDE